VHIASSGSPSAAQFALSVQHTFGLVFEPQPAAAKTTHISATYIDFIATVSTPFPRSCLPIWAQPSLARTSVT
jgi:hypothetical protein